MPYRPNFYFPIWSYISCNEFRRKNFSIRIKKNNFLLNFCSCGLPVPLITWSTCSGTCDFRLDFSRLFYLCKFSSVVHAKCSFPAFTEVKPARWKPEVTCSLIYVTTHSKPREDCWEWWTKMAANLNALKTSKKDCILSKSNFFLFAEVHWV